METHKNFSAQKNLLIIREVDVSKLEYFDDAQISGISDTQETGGVLAWQMQ